MRRKIDLMVLVAVLIAGYFAVQNAQALGDWWFLRSYSPTPEVIRIADDAGMNEKGRKLFYRFSPDFYTKEEINRHCSGEKLGCIEGQDIFILEYSTNAEYNRTVVTAAHEMLHVVYHRLEEGEKLNINKLLDKELAKSEAFNIKEKLEGYNSADYYAEAHSFVGTELKTVGAELEAHYSQYFKHRAALHELYLKSDN